MGKILNAIANDRLCVAPDIYRGSKEYRRARDLYCTLGDRLLERMDKEDQKLLQEYSDAQLNESSLYGDVRFIRGFGLGVLMMVEVMTDEDDLVLHEDDSSEQRQMHTGREKTGGVKAPIFSPVHMP